MKNQTIIEVEHPCPDSNKTIKLHMRVITIKDNSYYCVCVEDKGLKAVVKLIDGKYVITQAHNQASIVTPSIYG
jgi:hypothetical protein